MSQQINEARFQCNLCEKSFATERGRSRHLNYCRKKHPNTVSQLVDQSGSQGSTNTDTSVAQNRSESDPERCDLTYIWGSHTKGDLHQIVNGVYEEVVFWRKNLFMLPSGAAGKSFVKEMDRLISAWNSDSVNLSDISLKIVMIMPSLLLQKPSFKSKSKEHTICLKRRLLLWELGDFDALLREGRTIQSTLTASKRKMTSEQLSKTFASLMLRGKVNAALRLLDEQSPGGVLPLTDDVYEDLVKKHPTPKQAENSVMIEGEIPFVDPAMFANIDESTISRAAMNTNGAAGPSGLDALGWRHILVSRNYGDCGKDLRSSIASMARKLATQRVEIQDNQSTSIEAYLSCRLIPLDKNPGVRPIGIGEVLRRIIGKSVIATIKPQIVKSAGDLQLCAGQQAGCEAAVHAMSDILAEDETDGVLLVDATNAFNSINRAVMLHNIQHICPAMAIYTYNCYATASRLFVQGGKEITSAEGTTQGDPIAMPLYAVSITPLLRMIKKDEAHEVRHVAFADDLSGAGKLAKLRSWWDNIVTHGPLLGYYPRADKSWLIVKPDLEQSANEIFAGTDVRICTEGHKYLGGHIGSETGKRNYLMSLVERWCSQLRVLSTIAKFEPQAAYSAFVSGFRHRFTYHMRTIPDIQEEMQQIDNIINNQLLPALTDGRSLSSDERELLSLPTRFGGLGIPIFSNSCSMENENSKTICQHLTEKIVYQNNTTPNRETESVHLLRRQATNAKEANARIQLTNLRLSMTSEQTRANDLAQLKGSSIWLTTLPLAVEGYVLNKREFYDSIYLRYRWQLKRLPTYCACGKTFTVDHALSCLKGGFIHRRHDEIRDLLASAIDEVAYDVSTEPALASLTGETLPANTNRADEARVDIAARGFWQRCEKAFFDVRVFNPYASTYRNQSLTSAFNSNEREKKRQYNQRIVEVEHGSFTPVVFSANGGCGRETQHFLSSLAEKIANKKHFPPSIVMSWLRKKIMFSLLRSQVICIRGSRSLKKPTTPTMSDIELSERNSNNC